MSDTFKPMDILIISTACAACLLASLIGLAIMATDCITPDTPPDYPAEVLDTDETELSCAIGCADG